MSRLQVSSLLLILLAPGTLLAQKTAEPPVAAIRAGRVHTLAGPVLENALVVVRQGKILAVGKDIPVPEGAVLFEDPTAVVTPGLLDADAALGLDGVDLNEQSKEVLPHLRIADALDTRDPRFRRSLEAGITAVYVSPGSRGVIGGLGVVVKTTGGALSRVLVKADAGLKAVMGGEPSLGNRATRGAPTTSMFARRPTTRMGVVWLFREALYRYKDRDKTGGQKTIDPYMAPDMAVVERVASGEIPLRIHARMATDILTALRLAVEFGDLDLDLIVDEATEAYKVAPALARNRARVVLGPLYFAPRSSMERREGHAVAYDNAAVLHRAGVPFALKTAGDADPSTLRTGAGLLVRYGLEHAAALRALTLDAAKIIGVDTRLGSLEVGKDADLVVFDGDPLSPTTKVKAVMVGGCWVHVARQDKGGGASR